VALNGTMFSWQFSFEVKTEDNELELQQELQHSTLVSKNLGARD
jgi:hypothetical protein